MPNTVKYMVDDKGVKTAVLVPIKVWKRINEDYTKLQKLNKSIYRHQKQFKRSTGCQEKREGITNPK